MAAPGVPEQPVSSAPNETLIVVKVGGGLAAVPGALEKVCSALAAAARLHPIVIVPGGGPFADAVRQFDRRVGLSAEAAHWMAVLAMDQYAEVLASRIPQAVLLDDAGRIRELLGRGLPIVLAPSRWMRAADALPHSWDVTSDSIAAFVAGALGADRLVLIKPADVHHAVDPYFASALPAGMPYVLIGWDRLDDLDAWLRR
jgi:5-(aminomethyl)-3-furanmethanol phosphate kinase